MTLGEAALTIAERGLAVFPCKPRGKTPATRHGVKDATTDAATIRGWWSGGPELNIGIATGKASGLWVLDIDGADGEASLRAIEAEHKQQLPATVEAITGGGGRHLFFKLPDFDEAPEIRNSAGVLGPGLDVRGEGGYVIAPPSLHSSGRRYAWSVDSAGEFAEVPIWFLQRLAVPKHQGSVATLDARRAPDHWRNIIVRGVDQGARDCTAAALCGHFLREGISPTMTYELLAAWNAARVRPPLSQPDLVRIVRSIAEKELARRGQ